MTPPALSLEQAVAAIRPPDAEAMSRAAARQSTLTKPPGSLGQLEELSIRLAGILRTEQPHIRGKVIIFAAAAVVLAGPTGIVLLVVAGAVALGVGQFATSRLGGATGDVYGAVNELATMAMLVAASLIVLGDFLALEPIWLAQGIDFGFGDDSYAP